MSSNEKRTKAVLAAYLVLFRDGKVLLSQRANTGYYDGYFGLVSGHVEGKESFTEAVIREAFEEAGIQLEFQDLETCHVMHRYEDLNPPGSRVRVDVFILARNWRNDLINREPEKCSHLGWFNLSDLPENTIPYVKSVLNDIQAKKHYSEYGFLTFTSLNDRREPIEN